MQYIYQSKCPCQPEVVGSETVNFKIQHFYSSCFHFMHFATCHPTYLTCSVSKPISLRTTYSDPHDNVSLLFTTLERSSLSNLQH